MEYFLTNSLLDYVNDNSTWRQITSVLKILEYLSNAISYFQCSPQSEAEGIERTFESAKKFISDENNTQNRR